MNSAYFCTNFIEFKLQISDKTNVCNECTLIITFKYYTLRALHKFYYSCRNGSNDFFISISHPHFIYLFFLFFDLSHLNASLKRLLRIYIARTKSAISSPAIHPLSWLFSLLTLQILIGFSPVITMVKKTILRTTSEYTCIYLYVMYLFYFYNEIWKSWEKNCGFWL